MPLIQSLKPTRRGPVNPTARWPERLEHLATLLRADALAVVSATPAGASTVFSYHLDTAMDWFAALGPDVFARAARGAFVTAIPAGRWTDGAGYALVAPVEWNGTTILCGLREDLPFDTVEAVGAAAAARMLEMSASEGRAFAETLRESDSLQQQLREIARRMRAGAASIMVVEGHELLLRAAVGLPNGVRMRQRIGEGIAGWAAEHGEKLVLRGPVDDTRFRGVDPEAREAIVVPLRDGAEVLGVLNLKRPEGPDGFADRHELVDEIAAEVTHTLRSLSNVGALERERDYARTSAEIARAVAARDIVGALEATLRLGHHAVAVRDARGVVLGVRGIPGDDACHDSALRASATGEGGTRVGFARHGASYREQDTALTQRTADTLAFLARDLVTETVGALRVLAVEDHPVMRMGVRAMLEREGFVVAGATATVSEALGMLPDAAADVILLDLHLPDASGSEAVTRLRDTSPTLPIVVFSIDRTPGLIRAALRAGANGYVTKDAPVARLVAALRAAASGLVVMGPDEAIAAAAGVDPLPVDAPERVAPPPELTSGGGEAPREPLTPRELELLRYMAEGYTNKEVARAMVLAEDTVKKAVQTLIAKLGAADRTHAVVLALRSHLID